MKDKHVYRAEVWGVRLDDGEPTTGVKMVRGLFTNKAYMYNWARNQINKPDIKPFHVYFYIKRDGLWEFMTKALATIPMGKLKRRMLSWK